MDQENNNCKKHCYIRRNLGSVIALAVIYISIAMVLHATFIEHDVRITKDSLQNTIIILEKK